MSLHEILIDTEFSMFNPASACQPVINLILCDKIFCPDFHSILYRKFPFGGKHIIQIIKLFQQILR